MDNNTNGLSNGKCIDCGACGSTGCCPPTDCKMTNNCTYCSQYLRELKSTYVGYHLLLKMISKHKTQLPNDIIDEYNEIVEEINDMNTAIGFSKKYVEEYPWLPLSQSNFD